MYVVAARSGDWLYQLVEAASLILAGVAIFLTTIKLGSTYNSRLDKFGNSRFLPDALAVVWVIVPALILAIVRVSVMRAEYCAVRCAVFLRVSSLVCVRHAEELVCMCILCSSDRPPVCNAGFPPQSEPQLCD